MSIQVPEHVKSGGFVPEQNILEKMGGALSRLTRNPTPSADQISTGSVKGASEASYLAAVNDHLIPIDSDLASNEREMLTATVLWIQHVVQGYCLSIGWSREKFSDPDIRSSGEFADALLHSVTKYCAWTVPVGQKQYSQSYTGHVNVVSAVGSIVADSDTSGAEILGSVAAQITSQFANQDEGVVSVCDLFWESKYSNGDKCCQFAISPATKTELGSVVYNYLMAYENPAQRGWRDLFVDCHYDEFALKASSLQLQFNFDQWEAVRDTVMEKLGPFINQQIKYSTLS